jgi:hypothetical protein
LLHDKGLIKCQALNNPLDEDAEIEKIMLEHNDINIVRGGCYSNIILTTEQVSMLTRKINHANGNV